MSVFPSFQPRAFHSLYDTPSTDILFKTRCHSIPLLDYLKMTGWLRLPQELQLLIFEILAQNSASQSQGTTGKIVPAREHPLSRYACVCKTWQLVFERENYRHLTLDQVSVQELDDRVRGRMKLVEYIWLRIALQTYSCPDCELFGVTDHGANDSIAQETVIHLFRVLSRWGRDGIPAPSSLTLEISAHSPSDSQHGFANDLYFDISPFETGELRYGPLPYNDIGHG